MADYIYANIHSYPTRDSSSHILATWNSAGVTHGVAEVYWVKLFFSPTSNIYMNATWGIDDWNPFSDCGVTTVWDITSSLVDGGLYETWVNEEGYYVVLGVCWRRGDQAEGSAFCTWPTSNATASNFIISAAPSISFRNGVITIGALAPGRRVLEFRRTDTAYGGSTGITDEDTLNEMLWAAFLNTEAGSGYTTNPYAAYYALANNPILYRWAAGSYTVGVNFVSSTNRSLISAAIDSALSQINAALGLYGISFTRSGNSGDITVTVDSEGALFPDRPSGYTYGGTWSTVTTASGIITGATVKLANDFQEYAMFVTYETVALEELLQCMGAGYDQVEYPFDTTHTDFNYYNKASTMCTRDANILRLLYSSAVNPGDKYYDVCRKLNIPKGVYIPSSSEVDAVQTVRALNFLTPGGTYQIRAFIVDSSGMVSSTSAWITIVVPERSGATAYIYTGSSTGWRQATPYVYLGPSQGWVKTSPYIYNGGWKPT